MKTAIFRANLMTPGLNGRWGVSPRLYWGPPGCAKSARVKQEVHAVGLDCDVILASIRDPADFNGTPIPMEIEIHGKKMLVTAMAPPQWAVEAAQKENCVIFFDEISTASPAVQAALLRVVLDGAVGDLQLPPGVRFMAAANPTEMAAGGFDLSTPLANRFGHEDVNLSPGGEATISRAEMEDWCNWLLTSGESSSRRADIDPVAEQNKVLAVWDAEYARAKGEVVGFMYSAAGGPSALFNMPDLNDPRASRSWASFRTWECATRALAGSRIHGLSDRETDEWMMSLVGIGPVAQFRQYISMADLPNPQEFLANGGKGWTHDESRLDRTLAVLSGCTGLVCGMKESKQREKFVETLWTVMTPIAEKSTDACVPAVRALIAEDLAFGKAAARPLAKMRPVMKAVGVIR